MARVVVEGSGTPCADLPTGVRKTVEYTRGVRHRIRRGYYLLISGPTEDAVPPVPAAESLPVGPASQDQPVSVPSPESPAVDATPFDQGGLVGPIGIVVHDHEPGVDAPVAEDPLPVPAGNASAPVWLAFLRSVGVDVPVDGEGKTPGRDALKAIWRDHGVG